MSAKAYVHLPLGVKPNRQFKLAKHSQLFIRVHHETFSVAMCVSNPRSFAREQEMLTEMETQI
jgi:hypothetical protein